MSASNLKWGKICLGLKTSKIGLYVSLLLVFSEAHDRLVSEIPSLYFPYHISTMLRWYTLKWMPENPQQATFLRLCFWTYHISQLRRWINCKVAPKYYAEPLALLFIISNPRGSIYIFRVWSMIMPMYTSQLIPLKLLCRLGQFYFRVCVPSYLIIPRQYLTIFSLYISVLCIVTYSSTPLLKRRNLNQLKLIGFLALKSICQVNQGIQLQCEFQSFSNTFILNTRAGEASYRALYFISNIYVPLAVCYVLRTDLRMLQPTHTQITRWL